MLDYRLNARVTKETPMPELPDLEYIVPKLKSAFAGEVVSDFTVKNPIVIRQFIPGDVSDVFSGQRCDDILRKGPFIHFRFTGFSMVMHLMLAGRLRIAGTGEKSLPRLCFSAAFYNGTVLHYGDDKQMGKVYILYDEDLLRIPMYEQQGIDILSENFTFEYFSRHITKSGAQARVFIMDQSILSAVGNAYADEILFDAGIHPKTLCSRLSEKEIRSLYESINRVIASGIQKVREAQQPIEMKIRDHMKVRNRKDSPCPVCGTIIRRANVLGYDSFFCPSCQPQTRKQFIAWE